MCETLTQLWNRNVRLAVDQKLAGLHCAKSDDSLRQELDRLRAGSVFYHRVLLQTANTRNAGYERGIERSNLSHTNEDK